MTLRTWAVIAVLAGGLALPAGATTETIRLAQAAPAEQPALLEQLGQASADARRAAAERLGEIGDAAAADGLARALRDPDAGVREAAAASLWTVWMRSGDPAIDTILQQGISRMGEARLPDAVIAFSEVIRRAPRFAEGWNKRATAYYLMGELDRSLADCEEVIRLNPVHFGALSGFGLIYLQKDDLPHAAEYFERALAVNPDLGRVRAALEEIRAVLAERRRQSI